MKPNEETVGRSGHAVSENMIQKVRGKCAAFLLLAVFATSNSYAGFFTNTYNNVRNTWNSFSRTPAYQCGSTAWSGVSFARNTVAAVLTAETVVGGLYYTARATYSANQFQNKYSNGGFQACGTVFNSVFNRR